MHGLLSKFFRKLVKGFEPPTYGLQIRCSTVELHQQYLTKHLVMLPSMYIIKFPKTSQYHLKSFLIFEGIFELKSDHTFKTEKLNFKLAATTIL